MNRTTRHLAAAGALAMAAALVAGGCGESSGSGGVPGGGSAPKTAAPFQGDPNSPYCREAAGWAAHELTPHDETDPKASRAYWGEYSAFLSRTQPLAPPDIAPAWASYVHTQLGQLGPVLQKYGYDTERIQNDGSPEEQALFQGPPPGYEESFGRILAYESSVCGTTQPAPADEELTGPPDSAYCQAQQQQSQAFSAILGQGAAPDAVRAHFEAEGFGRYLETITKAAPDPIAADVGRHVEFTRRDFVPTLTRFGYDFRRLLREGSPQDRHVFSFATPDERGPFARQAAYDQKVCGA